MADWDESVTKIEGEANTFASYLLMPLDDFRAQIKGRAIDIDVMTELSDRYAVSLTAAIQKWMTIDLRAGCGDLRARGLQPLDATREHRDMRPGLGEGTGGG